MTAVYDTNILISALLSTTGSPFRCVALVRLAAVDLVICEEILNELQAKLLYRLGFSADKAQAAVDLFREMAKLIEIPGKLQAVAPDPKDDMILECAVSGRADYVVTGDRRHLLPLESYQGIRIVTANQFLQIILPDRGDREP